MSIFITAEIGINHNGDLSIAKKLIDIAVSAGCNAVKFQKRTVEKAYSKEIPEKVKKELKKNIEIININTDKKYLSISTF